jgi:ubiquitin carboxyl-terminal hydrolase 14
MLRMPIFATAALLPLLCVQVEKYSDVLGRNAVWTKTQRIKKLPRYLCVQFMRFFWKATPDSRDHVGVKCKVSNT